MGNLYKFTNIERKKRYYFFVSKFDSSMRDKLGNTTPDPLRGVGGYINYIF